MNTSEFIINVILACFYFRLGIQKFNEQNKEKVSLEVCT